jgi:hypothetical protein
MLGFAMETELIQAKLPSQGSQDEQQKTLNIALNNIFGLAGVFNWMSAH